MKTHHLFK